MQPQPYTTEDPKPNIFTDRCDPTLWGQSSLSQPFWRGGWDRLAEGHDRLRHVKRVWDQWAGHVRWRRTRRGQYEQARRLRSHRQTVQALACWRAHVARQRLKAAMQVCVSNTVNVTAVAICAIANPSVRQAGTQPQKLVCARNSQTVQKSDCPSLQFRRVSIACASFLSSSVLLTQSAAFSFILGKKATCTFILSFILGKKAICAFILATSCSPVLP